MSAATPHHLLHLDQGLRVALDESGDPHGFPLFFCHGWPASRLQGAGFGPVASTLGLRILSPDRPGIGLSTAQPGRRLLDWPPILQEVARHLGIERFLLLAVSGGGPYAMAAAYALPEEVQAVAVVSGAPPLRPGMSRHELMLTYRFLLHLNLRQPLLLRRLFRMARPFATFRPPRWTWPILRSILPSTDREALRDDMAFEGSMDCTRESWRTSADGVNEDAQVYANDWGFDVRDIRVPVRLWHGKADHAISWRLVEAMAARIPNCATHFLEGEGHFSLPIRHGRAILEDLLVARDSAVAV